MGYWGPSMMRGVYPKFHAKAITGPAVFTGVTWAMGNFNAMFGTVYLGQTIGFPLTQCCLVLNGILGIAYFQELQGRGPIGLFCLASLIIFAGLQSIKLVSQCIRRPVAVCWLVSSPFFCKVSSRGKFSTACPGLSVWLC